MNNASTELATEHRGKEFTTGTLLVLLTVVVWGVQFPVAKQAFETVNAWHSAVFRFSLPALILVVALILREGWGALKTGPDSLRILALGFLGMSAAPSLIFGAVMFTRPEIAAIVVATQPLLTVFVQRLSGGEKPGFVSLFCITLAFLGVITVVTRWQAELNLSVAEVWANVMLLVGALCFVFYTMGCSRFQHWSSLRLTSICMLVGAVANTLLVVILVQVGLITHPTIAEWFHVRWELLFLALVGVLGAMFTWTVGARRVGALNAMLFINLIPVVTFTIRYWQGYRFENIELIGAAMVIGALSTQNLYMRWQLSKRRMVK